MTLRDRYKAVLDYFAQSMPSPESELHFADTYQLLTAVILSAQCTDKRVNLTTPALFERFGDVRAMAAASPEQIYPYIKSVSYPNNKARNLHGMACAVVERFGGEIPDSVEALQTLPGVGRKTANVVGAVAFDRNVMPVDTHVFRVSERLGLSSGAKTPLQTEQRLTRHIPAPLLSTAHHWLLLHGRYVCTARKPHCDRCGVSGVCRYYNRNKKATFVK